MTKLSAIACFSGLALAACPGPAPTPTFNPWTLEDLTAAQGIALRGPELEVASGVETQVCYFIDVPDINNGQPIFISHTKAAVNPGSHHLNVFRVKTIKNLNPAKGTATTFSGLPATVVTDGECFKSPNWSDWPLVLNTQNSKANDPYTDWQLPPNVAHKFTPGEKLIIQSHYVNATTQATPFKGKVGINLYKSPDAAPMEIGTLFATQQSIRICQSNPTPSYQGSCHFPKTSTLTIVAANGHFHSRGKKFRIFSWDGKSDTAPPDSDKFYESDAWDEPPMMAGLDLSVPNGGGVRWICDYQWTAPPAGCDALNADDPMKANDCCYRFGPKVDANEHCNAFVYYYPRVENNVGVFCN